MINNKRYVLQKFISYDEKAKLETWMITTIKSDNLDALMNFLSNGYRIFDTVSNKEVIRN
ncbi:hypothetical protein [Paenibacillus sp. XY044]|uniref:hypothetical protein n=1 Tax=Paenibacillus sp. XY044 TaxID=2026089 RepID=UPI000B97D9E3|nr:hypothetical protein [Paenibacillus sp. XY044]OZB98072.1 hypothetical protein CJP46_02580 [Paenibacillus sp. XY044]